MIPMMRTGLVAALIVLVGAAGLRAEHDAATPAQEMIEETVHDYLLSHPDVMIKVFDILRARQEAGQAEQTRQTVAARREALFNDPAAPVAGNPDGDVTLVEFFDYRCTYCKRVLPTVIAALEEDPGLRIVYKEFPILGPESVVAARVALAAHRQAPDRYLALHTALMASRGRLTETNALEIAREFGFDVARIAADMGSPEIDRIIERNNALAQELGINGTPGFVIGDRVIPGAIDLDTLRRLIAEARQS